MRVGYAVIRPYNPALAGVDYVLKGLNPAHVRKLKREHDGDRDSLIEKAQVGTLSGHYSAIEANQYELGKYAKAALHGEVDAAIPSHSLLFLVAGCVDRKTKKRQWFLDRRRRGKHTSRKTAEKR